MTKGEFIDLLRNPLLMSKEQSFDIEDVVNDFPYFQSAHVLHLKGLKNLNSFRYNQTLKTTAVYTTDRSVLFKFITSSEFDNAMFQKTEKDIISKMEKLDEKIIENIFQPQENISKEEENPNLITENNTSESEIIKNQKLDIQNNDTENKNPLNNFDENVTIRNEENILLLENKNIEESADEFLEILKEEKISNSETDNLTEKENKPSEEVKINIAKEEKIFQNDSVSYIENTKDKIEEIEEKEEIIFELITEEIFEEKIQNQTADKEIQINLKEDFSSPVTFYKNESRTFNDWLKIATFKPINRQIEPTKNVTLDEKINLIDEFIVRNPKIEPVKEKNPQEISNIQMTDNEEIMTETLARVYVLQHKYADAIKAYQILSLKFPEKSSFFASQIKQIEILRKNNFN